MRKIACLIFSLFMFVFLTSSQETKTIDYTVVSFKLPSTWEPYRGETLQERKVQLYNKQYAAWHTPIKSVADIPPIMLNVDIYSRLDNTDLSIAEIQDFLFEMNKRKIIEESDSAMRKDLICKRESKDMDGSLVVYNELFTFYKKGKEVVCLTLVLTEDRYKEKGVKELIKKIQSSYIF